MNANANQNTLLPNNPNGYSISELISALTPRHCRLLAGFVRVRLEMKGQSRWLRECLAATTPEDLVQEALLKLLLGEANPSLGRHLQPQYRVNLTVFISAVKSIIASDISNLANAARHRHKHIFIGDPETEPGAVNPPHARDTYGMLSRRDLHHALFKQLYQRIHKQPALLAVVQDWEHNFWQSDRIGGKGANRLLLFRVRKLAREIIAELASEISPQHGDGREMLF